MEDFYNARQRTSIVKSQKKYVSTNELSIGVDGELASNVDYVSIKFFPKTHTLTSQDTTLQNQKKIVSQKLEK